MTQQVRPGPAWLRATSAEPDRTPERGSRVRLDRGDAVLLGLALVIALGYLAMGVGPVLDDWFALRNAHFDGALRAAGSDQIAARPAGSLIYALVFGVFGRAIAPTVLLLALVNALSAALVRRLIGWIAPDRLALLCAVLWLVLPSTTSIEVWASASNISVGLALALGAVYLGGREAGGRGRRRGELVACAVLGALAVLCYEALLVLVVFGACSIAARLRTRAAIERAAASVVGSLAAFAWVLTHWHPRKDLTTIWGDVGSVVPANLGADVAGWPAWVLIGPPVLIVSALALSFANGGVRPVRRLLLLGWAVMAIGVLPFVKYTYAPVGAGDRVNVISSLGGALLIGTTAWVVGRGRRTLATVLVAIVCAIVVPARVSEMWPWAEAADDATAVLAAVREEAVPGEPVVIGPTLVARGGVTAMQLPYIAEAAVQLVLDAPHADATLTTSEEQFEAMEGTKIDLRSVLGPDADDR